MILKFRGSVAVAALVALSACGLFKGDGKTKTPVLGQRVPILIAETGVEVDPALADVAVTVPAALVNAEWSQPGGNASKSMGHVALSAVPAKVWSKRIAGGEQRRSRLASAPVISGGRLYVVDTRARLHAFDAATGSEVYTVTVGDEKDVGGGMSFLSGEMTGNSGVVFGGGVSVDGERLYATNGLGDVVAFNTADGAVLWKVRPGGPLRGAPTLSNGLVYVISQDNQLFALNQSDGKVQWTESSAVELAGVFGVAAPAAAQGSVVAGFSSGDLNAYRYENGRVLWQDALSRTSISTSVGTLSDIDADPVIDQGRVYAIGQGGRMVALELVTGQRLWEINAAGISTPWVAGEWLFVVTENAQLLAVARATGRVRWSAQLPRYRDEEDKEGPLSWQGPVLAGGKLVLVSSDGRLVSVAPETGAIERTVETDAPVFLPPVVANEMLYLLDNQGRLTAWR